MDQDKQSIQSAVLNRANTLANACEDMANRVQDKLQPVSLPEPLTKNVESDAATPQEAYPPLYDELRSALYRCELALEAISVTLSTTHL